LAAKPPVCYAYEEGVMGASALERARALLVLRGPRGPMVPPTAAETSAYVADVQRRLELLNLMPDLCPQRVGLIVSLFEGVMQGSGKRVMAYNAHLRATIQAACDRLVQGAVALDQGQPWLLPPLRAVQSGLTWFLGYIRQEDCYRACLGCPLRGRQLEQPVLGPGGARAY